MCTLVSCVRHRHTLDRTGGHIHVTSHMLLSRVLTRVPGPTRAIDDRDVLIDVHVDCRRYAYGTRGY